MLIRQNTFQRLIEKKKTMRLQLVSAAKGSLHPNFNKTDFLNYLLQHLAMIFFCLDICAREASASIPIQWGKNIFVSGSLSFKK